MAYSPTKSEMPPRPTEPERLSALSSERVDDGTKLEAQRQPSSTGAAPLDKGKTVLVMFPLAMVVFIAALDTVSMTVALYSIVLDLKASDTSYSWIASSYLLAQCVSAPIWGRLSDIFGRKPMLLIANGVFFVTSLMAALSVDVAMLLVARVLQGLGAGGLLLLANICVTDLFPLQERAKYLGILSAVWAIAVALAPLIGGALTEQLSWRWIFWINLPCIALSTVFTAVFVRVHTPRISFRDGLAAVDWLGTALIIPGTTMLLVGLQLGSSTDPWSSPAVLCLIIFGALLLVGFGFVEWRVTPKPLIPPAIFTQLYNVAALAVNFCQSLAFMACAFFLPLYFQLVLGASPLLSGVWFLPLAMAFSFFCVATGAFIKKTGHYLLVVRVGLIGMTLGCGLFINLQPYISWPRIICFQIVAAMGIGLNFFAPLLALQANLQPETLAAGTSAFQFVRMLSNAVSLVIGQVLFQSQVQAQTGSLRAAGVPPALVEQLELGNTISAAELIPSLSPSQFGELGSALTSGFSRMWIFYTALSLLGLLASFALTKRPPPPKLQDGQADDAKKAILASQSSSRPVSRPVMLQPKPSKQESPHAMPPIPHSLRPIPSVPGSLRQNP